MACGSSLVLSLRHGDDEPRYRALDTLRRGDAVEILPDHTVHPFRFATVVCISVLQLSARMHELSTIFALRALPDAQVVIESGLTTVRADEVSRPVLQPCRSIASVAVYPTCPVVMDGVPVVGLHAP